MKKLLNTVTVVLVLALTASCSSASKPVSEMDDIAESTGFSDEPGNSDAIDNSEELDEDENDEDIIEASEPDPADKNRIILAMRPPQTLNPLLNEDVSIDRALQLMFEHVAVLNEAQEPVPNLAESIVYDSDGLGATIVIRDNIYWSDGTKVTAGDVTFSLQTIKNVSSANAIYKDVVRNISAYNEIDSQTLRITQSRPTGGLGYALCFPVIPAHYYRYETVLDSEKNMNPVGCGPYIFEDYTLAKEVKLTANLAYFKGRPAIDRIDVMITSDSETDFYAFDQSIIDVLTADILDWGKYSGTKPTIITEFATNYYDFVGFNFKNSFLTARDVREAIAHCIDIEDMVESIYLGHASRTGAVINPVSWAYEEDMKHYDYDKQLAISILKGAGFEDRNGDGILELDMAGVYIDFSIRLLVNEESNERMKLAEILVSNLREVGIATELIACDFDTYIQKLSSGDFDLFLGGFNFSVAPDFSFAFSSSQIDLGSNYFYYRNETLDNLLSASLYAPNQESLGQYLSEIQKHIAEELPCISLVFRKSAIITDEKIMGDKIAAINSVFYNINDWYITRSEY